MRSWQHFCALTLVSAPVAASATGQEQSKPGAGNSAAVRLSERSPMALSAQRYLIEQARTIADRRLRSETLELLTNQNACVQHRAGLDSGRKQQILETLKEEGLLDAEEAAKFPGGALAGLFPPLLDEGSGCVRLPQTFQAAPGSEAHGHHSYPGGLAVHEAFNERSAIAIAGSYEQSFGVRDQSGSPVFGNSIATRISPTQLNANDLGIHRDELIAAPVWHDWAKIFVLQWNADGTVFKELHFGGNGRTDAFGAAGDSRTYGHHILSLAEAMKRGLPAEFVITVASAHASPGLGNEYKVVNWLRAAAIVAQIDPIERGYLTKNAEGRWQLPAVSGSASEIHLRAEYAIDFLSDGGFVISVPAESEAEAFLAKLAPEFGYLPADAARYNWQYRNPVFSFLTEERLLFLFDKGGLDAVRTAVQKLRQKRAI
ncbi:MAG TPA: hypothetical protein VK525_08745 [Candidatus Saccharimonadales bacterium]|nr:hypothetical protein [Candidatus Saccharimonadales bacterium]